MQSRRIVFYWYHGSSQLTSKLFSIYEEWWCITFLIIIQVERKIFFSNESAPEVGTSCASMNRTGKTNAKKGPKEDHKAFKEFHDREIEGHVLTSFMNYSGMSSMEGKSCKHNKICSTKTYVHKYVTWVF